MKDHFTKYYTQLGSNIKKARLNRGWSQNELAKRCSVNAAKISKIENAREDIMLSTILEITLALEVSLGELFEEI